MNEKKTDILKNPTMPCADLACDGADLAPSASDPTAEVIAPTESIHTLTNTHITQKLQRRSDALRENLLKRKQQMRART
ncbi:MAG: hypothetical protein K2X53_01440 [Alphaproteobacteria bacterium]|nr:hypothetical protein [Alphaproteobacteria bacterium]